MNIAIWIAQVILAAMFLMAGFMKLSQPKEKLKEKVGGWVDDVSDGAIKSIGMVEVLGALGLILPMLIGIVPVLTVVAAVGLSVTMIGAAALHLKRKEHKQVGTNVVLLIVALFVVIGRLYLVPII